MQGKCDLAALLENGQMKTTQKQYAEQFKRDIADIARQHNVPESRVYVAWQLYSDACQAGD